MFYSVFARDYKGRAVNVQIQREGGRRKGKRKESFRCNRVSRVGSALVSRAVGSDQWTIHTLREVFITNKILGSLCLHMALLSYNNWICCFMDTYMLVVVVS